MIKLIDYGEPIESTKYSFEGNKLNKINCELFINNTDILIDVSEKNGKIYRKVSYCAGYSERVIDKFELRVEDGIFGPRFDFTDVIIYRYETAFEKSDATFKVSIDPINNDNKSICLYVDKNNVAIYHRNMGIVKVYPSYGEGNVDFSNLIEELIITDFGVISRSRGKVCVVYKTSEKVLYVCERHDEFDIDCFRDRCIIVEAYGKKFFVSYDLNNMVSSVKCKNELYSRSEIETSKRVKKGNDISFTTFTDSIYPSFIMSNYIHYGHKFLSAWNHDLLIEDSKDGIISFSRKVYAIDKIDHLLEKLRSDPNNLIINY